MVVNMTHNERQEIARRHIDSAEAWLRKIIHHQMSSKYGQNYLGTIQSGTLNKRIITAVAQKKNEEQGRITRDIDATTLDQAIDVVTHPVLYEELFKKSLKTAYPLGIYEARHFLTQIKDIRNDVSHGRGCSQRQLERSICYSNDLIDSLKDYFRSISMEKEFNVPMIVHYVDCLGNESHMDNVPLDIGQRIIDWRKGHNGILYPGDTLVAEVEIDQSFDPSEYQVRWFIFGFPRQEGSLAQIKIENKHVNEQMEIGFEVISKRDWHRHHGLDDAVRLLFRVRPPLT